ncbi:MAG: right-handed parallel beta-helix repeat-containing protein [Chitinophagaceae bacterium]|nr:right-handed parallel beta-helix repeat-containing protein [Chitinophagaceae bacterium]
MIRVCKWHILLGILISLSSGLFAQQLVIRNGMKISKSIRFNRSNTFLQAPADTSSSVILIEGENIVIDFGGTELRGDRQQSPDTYTGVAVLIRNSRNVTIRNLKARGYKIALSARNTRGLVLENCDFSYNYRQQLGSTQEKEDMSDWMSYHQNEKDEWLRYGAAIYLKDCNQPIVRNCRVTGGQTALMMMRCNNFKIYNNDFSFNSVIGIGLYRSSGNEISFNRLNFNVRGYSHGVYHRGQDSAGILVYEQSSFNVFYKNSATHSGDGFFLWAGQTTMDSGEGGCNYNEILSNDFSYAPTNGVEVTFSRVRVANNRLFDCDHGIWGGYSYASKFTGNHLRNNRIGIAIEHGQYNEITDNIFIGDREAVKLWSRKNQPADWGYAKYRDTRSVGYVITGNSFNSNPVVFSLKGTDSLQIANNRYEGYGAIWQLDSTVTNLDSTDVELLDTTLVLPVVLNPIDPFKGNGKLAGKHNIMITEWGPYDFRYPMIWQTNPVEKGDTLRFDILGPKGSWEIKSSRGLEKLSSTKGSIPASITAVSQTNERTDILLELVYKGAAFTNNTGEPVKAGKPYLFQFRKFFQPINWEVLYYSMDTAYHNPIRTGMLFSMTERKAPVLTQRKDRLDEAWWGGIRAEGTSYPQFFTVADGTGDFLPGNYELSVTWDDAVRVYVDGKLVLDEWNPSKYSFDESPRRKLQLPLGGKHSFRVEHVELGGFACLSLKIKPL